MSVNFRSFWLDIIKKADENSISDPVFLQIVNNGGASHQFVNASTDEELRTLLSVVKRLLNSPKTVDTGAFIFTIIVSKLPSERLEIIQGHVLQIIRLLCQESQLSSPFTLKALSVCLPKCTKIQDVLKELTPKKGLVGKIIGFIHSKLKEDGSGAGKGILSIDQLLQLLQICVENFRGSCGPSRKRLEISLLRILNNNSDGHKILNRIAVILPLLSATGGAGTSANGHSDDWLLMINKIIRETYNTIMLLFGHSCPAILEMPHPFEEEEMDPETLFPPIDVENVFKRLSLLIGRVENQFIILKGYLKGKFPSAKKIPVEGILILIRNIINVDSSEMIGLLGKQLVGEMQETLFISTMLPQLHLSAFHLLSTLINTLGTNVFPFGQEIEQLFTAEINYFGTLPKAQNIIAFEQLKTVMFKCIACYLRKTKGQTVSALQTNFKQWIELLVQCISVDSQGSGTLSCPGASTLNLLQVSPNAYVTKNPLVCGSALKVMILLIPTISAFPNYEMDILRHAIDAHVKLYRQRHYPSQYADSSSRILLNDLLLRFHQNSNALRIPIINLLEKSAQVDLSSRVKNFCDLAKSQMERSIHPSCLGLQMSMIDGNNDQSTNIVATGETINDQNVKNTDDMEMNMVDDNEKELHKNVLEMSNNVVATGDTIDDQNVKNTDDMEINIGDGNEIELPKNVLELSSNVVGTGDTIDDQNVKNTDYMEMNMVDENGKELPKNVLEMGTNILATGDTIDDQNVKNTDDKEMNMVDDNEIELPNPKNVLELSSNVVGTGDTIDDQNVKNTDDMEINMVDDNGKELPKNVLEMLNDFVDIGCE